MARVPQEKIIEAIRASRGLILVAAKILNIDPKTIRNRRRKSPKIDEAIRQEREMMIDIAEQKLFEKVDAGDAWGIGKVLDNLGRDRGYGARADINLNLTPADLAKMTDEELESHIARVGALTGRT